jgi:glycosyltransferase involved in cell wall biosynthesis
MGDEAVTADGRSNSAARARDLNLLLLNLQMDAADENLGFTTAWARGLARRFNHVTVITMALGEVELAPNLTVYSVGKERGFSEPRRLLEFYRLVRRALRERPVDVCLAHQQPKFAILFAPVAKSRRIPILLSFGHGDVSRSLRVAHLLADRCISSSAAGFRIPSDKLFIVGQGIDTNVFRPSEAPPPEPTTALSVGRINAVKRLDEMIEAVRLLRQSGREVRLLIVGGPLTEADRRHLDVLRERVRQLRVDDLVSFEGPVPFAEVPAWYHRATIFLNLSETRSLDKAYLEAMASGCVPISRNESFQAIARERGFEWLVPEPGANGLAHTIGAVLELGNEARSELLGRLRRTVEEDHDLDGLMDRITGHLVAIVDSRRATEDGKEDRRANPASSS